MNITRLRNESRFGKAGPSLPQIPVNLPRLLHRSHRKPEERTQSHRAKSADNLPHHRVEGNQCWCSLWRPTNCASYFPEQIPLELVTVWRFFIARDPQTLISIGLKGCFASPSASQCNFANKSRLEMAIFMVNKSIVRKESGGTFSTQPRLTGKQCRRENYNE